MNIEYVNSQFDVESKKLQFKSNSGKLTEVHFKIRFPEKFEVLTAQFTADDQIVIEFKGTDGCTLAENLLNSKTSKTEKLKVELGQRSSIPGSIKIEYILAKVSDTCKPNFVPDTAGGGILVGTGG